MSNNFISPHNLPSISDYLRRREACIVTLISELTLSDLEEIADFEEAKSRIENEVTLTPVELNEAEFTHYEVESLTNKTDVSKNSNRHIHRISIPFIGDKVIFSCSPHGGVPKSTQNPIVIIPLKNSLIINVGLHEYNPNLAMERANEYMQHTLSLIEKNNKTVIEWNNIVSQTITKTLEERKEQLLRKKKFSAL